MKIGLKESKLLTIQSVRTSRGSYWDTGVQSLSWNVEMGDYLSRIVPPRRRKSDKKRHVINNLGDKNLKGLKS